MRVYKNVLPQEVLELYDKEISQNLKQGVWQTNEAIWDEKLRVGISGLCLSTPVSVDLFVSIENSIKKYLPAYNNLVINHCVWHKNSGISLHPDANHVFGATIYLNKNWDMNYGGLFIWKDQSDDLKSFSKNEYYGRMNALCPTYNMLVLNNNYSWHMVTAVSPYAPENRITLQIWAD